MTGGYIFLNSLFYLITKLQLSSLAGAVLYIGYSALISVLFFILSGKWDPRQPFPTKSLASNMPRLFRFHWLLCQLVVRPAHLLIHQD